MKEAGSIPLGLERESSGVDGPARVLQAASGGRARVNGLGAARDRRATRAQD